MPSEQFELVRDSFARMEVTRVVPLFRRRLFELEPRLAALFQCELAAEDAKLTAALGAVVASLDRLHRILPVVRELGRRHAASGVRPDHYATVGEALIWPLEQAHGPGFTRATRRAWTDAYGRLAWAMVAAAEEDRTFNHAA
jgi:hemoglobin-like flavoprotein